MLVLEQTQSAFMQALDRGPEYMPQGMFAGSSARALLGMKVHANTISHARLIALEDTFPRTRAHIGHDRFNEHSRRFLDRPGVTARPLATIGQDFPLFLALNGETEEAADLAQFEWAWLMSYHAAEAVALALPELAGCEATTLMEVMIARHPAASMGSLDCTVRRMLDGEVPGLASADAVMLTRPEAQVLVSPATRAMWAIFARLERPSAIGNLFAVCTEPDCKEELSPDDFMPALIALIEAGALQRVE